MNPDYIGGMFQDDEGKVFHVTDFFIGKAPEEVPGMTPVEEPEEYKFELESFNMENTKKLPVDQILDLYNDYCTLHEITGENKFAVRAYTIMSILKSKQRKEVS